MLPEKRFRKLSDRHRKEVMSVRATQTLSQIVTLTAGTPVRIMTRTAVIPVIVMRLNPSLLITRGLEWKASQLEE
jgi:hypothetical protein